MPRWLRNILQAIGVFRALDFLYAIWVGKSLLWIALVSVGSVMISTLAAGFKWADLDKIILIAAAIYAVLALGWLASILVYRKISPQNKFVITGFHFSCQPIVAGAPRVSNNFQAAINLKNIAEFPISYQVTGIDFRVQNTVGAGQFLNRGALIDPGQESSFSSEVVIFHHPVNLPVTGNLTAVISYGHLRKEKFQRPISIRVFFTADSTMPSGVSYRWAIV